MKNLLFLLLLFFLFSCEKENLAVSESKTNANKNLPIVCNVKDPINNLAWLQSKIKEFKQSTYLTNRMNIWLSMYKGQELIIIYYHTEDANFVTDSLMEYYTCTGQLYCDYNNKPCPDNNEFSSEILPRVKFFTKISK
jgi:hypothetical protein